MSAMSAPSERIRRLDVAALAAMPLGEVEVVMAVRLGELHVHHVAVAGGAVERVPGGVRAAVLHGLEHRGHVAADVPLATAVAVDDAGDPAHG